MNKKVRLILNPKAGRGLNNRITQIAVRAFIPHVYDVEILYSKYVRHAVELSKQAAENNYEIVVAVGGDGTINEVAQSIKNTNTSLGIIPTGSGNGFARHFKIPLQIDKAIDIIKQGKIKPVDSLTINGKFCLNIAGAGFDAHIAYLFANYGKRGFSSYAKLVAKEYFKYREKNFQITYNGTTVQKKAFLIAVANATQFGNNARIASAAALDDGIIDLVILKKIPLIFIPLVIPRLFSGTMCNSKYVEILKSTSFTIECDERIPIHLDGEPNDPGKKIEAEISPLSVKVIVP